MPGLHGLFNEASLQQLSRYHSRVAMRASPRIYPRPRSRWRLVYGMTAPPQDQRPAFVAHLQPALQIISFHLIEGLMTMPTNSLNDDCAF